MKLQHVLRSVKTMHSLLHNVDLSSKKIQVFINITKDLFNII